MKNDSKTYLYIDGTNLFAAQYELFGPNKFLDFSSLISEIEKIIHINKVFFYASYSPDKTKKGKIFPYILNERLFYKSVKDTENVSFFKGSRSASSGKEKGVDVHFAVDIVKHLYTEKCSNIAIITGDADLHYPINIAKDFGKKVYYFTFQNRYSPHIAYLADSVTMFCDKSEKKLYKTPQKMKFLHNTLQIIEIKRKDLVIKKPQVQAHGAS